MLISELFGLCAVFFAACYLGTGGDGKNVKQLASYPDAVVEKVSAEPRFAGKVKPAPPAAAAFVSNLILFGVVLGLLALPLRTESFLRNFLILTVLGQGLNLFDLLVIDLMWWRNSPRIRFSTVPEPALYRDPKKHIASFRRGAVCFLAVALVDGAILTVV